MNAAQIALARHHSYTLLGRLFLEGIQPGLLPFVRGIPQLARALPEPFDEEEAAAGHQHLWGFNLFPFESIFLDESGLLEGAATARVQAQYWQAGFDTRRTDTSADHIGFELRFLAYLSAAEAEAWEDGLQPVASRMQHLQRDFLYHHLLRWLLPLVRAMWAQGIPFYCALAELTLEMVQGHSAELGTSVSRPWSLPTPPSLLADERTGLREIAAYLTTPAYSGLFFSRDDIARLAREHDLPRGFGGRQQMLLNLLRAAAQYDALPGLIARLHQRLAAEQAAFHAWSEQPDLAPFTRPWRARVGESLLLMEHLHCHLGQVSED
jgi:TorA maturation chaperone TorD